MLGYALKLENYVVHIYLDISYDFLFEDSVHQSLVCRAYVF